MEWDETEVLGHDEELPGVSLEEDISGTLDTKLNDLNQQYIAGITAIKASGLVDIGNLAAWKVSSYKPGYGVEALREENPATFWQSDGPQPHHIDIHFPKRVSIERVSLFTDYVLDESYTPSKVSLSSGSGYHDLTQISSIDMYEPKGWTHIKLDNTRRDGVMKAFLVRISIISNHQNGKDTHVRALKVFSPNTSEVLLPTEGEDELVGMTSITMMSESSIR